MAAATASAEALAPEVSLPVSQACTGVLRDELRWRQAGPAPAVLLLRVAFFGPGARVLHVSMAISYNLASSPLSGRHPMLPWIPLDTATAPDGGTLRLFRRGEEFSIRLADGNELMNSRLGGSEEALATLALAQISARTAPRVLIGGLGMGFTLRAAQAAAPADARLIVLEIVPELVAWARVHMGAVFGDCLADPRLDVITGDVAAEILAGPNAWDAILLDVDNGPDGLTRPDNDALYSDAGLRAARRALTPGGVLAVWSASPDPDFSARLAQCGFAVSARTVRAGRAKRGARHTIWIAVRQRA